MQKEPTVARDTIQSHLRALQTYLENKGSEQEYASVQRMVEASVSAYKHLNRVPAAPVGKNLDLVSQWLNEPNIGLKLGPYSSRHHPRLDFFFRQKHLTLRDYCEMLKRYLGITTDVLRIDVVEGDGIFTLIFQPHPDIYVSRQQVEGAVASVCDAVKTNHGITPMRVNFRHENETGNISLYCAILGIRPVFGAAETSLSFPFSYVQKERDGSEFFTYPLRQIQAMESHHRNDCQDQSWTERCRFFLGILLSYGEPTKISVSVLLTVTPRTLQRRLTDEGETFRNILNRVREEKAKKYLSNPEMTYEDIAFLLGFKDTGVFYRSFRRWTDSTPGEFRSAIKDMAER